MFNNAIRYLLLMLAILTWGCNGGGGKVELEFINESINSVPLEHWQQLKEKKIYWGHQSVGLNILGGIQVLLKEHPQIPLKVVEVKEPYRLEPGALNHSSVGNNCDPSSKVKDFVKIVDNGIGGQADLAFFKFCYIDFNARSDMKSVFMEYKAGIKELKERFPRTQFMHVTIPLLKVQTGPKAWVKKIIGRTLDGTNDNVKRCEYNEMIREEYQGEDPIFDIARAESTRFDGSRETFELDGKTFFALVPAYTNDGGHLNEVGSRILAADLLKVLAQGVTN